MTPALVGWLDHGTVRGEWAASMVSLVAHSIGAGILGGTIRIDSGPILDVGRNRLAAAFLDTGAEWLLMVDTDMTFEPDALERLLANDAPVVGALTWGYTAEVGQFPTMYRANGDGHPQVVYDDEWERGDLVPVDATGAACLLVHRDVFTKTERWFDRRQISGEWVGEDLSFCLKVREAGYDVLVDTGVTFDHLRPGRMSWETYETRRPH